MWLEELGYGSCRRLLAEGVVGRVALWVDEGPRILPVTYALVGESVVMRTARAGLLATVGPQERVAFEVDHVDLVRQGGWSVLAVGRLQPVTDPDELATVARAWTAPSWADRDDPVVLRLVWSELTGRRLGPLPRGGIVPARG